MSIEFKPWPKIPRPKGMNIIITEKIDGKNACVVIQDGQVVAVQSRKRFIEVGDDDMGFAAYVEANKKELVTLGDGHHFGEWAGPGIRKNPHKLKEKTFFLFDTHRPHETLPDCVKQVPVLYNGPYTDSAIDTAYTDLWYRAEREGYKPEGVIVYYLALRQFVKHTYANQDGKWVNT